MHTPGCIDTSIPAAEPEPEPEPEPQPHPWDWAMKTNTTMNCEEKPAFVSHRSDVRHY